jgi:hemoglobin
MRRFGHTWLMLLGAVSISLASINTALADSEAQGYAPSLYSRLGGLAPISVVVNDFIDVLVTDSILNQNPAVNASRKRVPAAYLKYHVTSLMCHATGGPCQYQGRSMKVAHFHLNITEKEWNRMIFLFKEVLALHKVPELETYDLLHVISTTKANIVMLKS